MVKWKVRMLLDSEIYTLEDNKTIANNIKKYLELSDFEVSICENGLF